MPQLDVPPARTCKQLEPLEVQAPAAFSICRASRAIAHTQGYKTWKIFRPGGKVRHLLWNPLIDTIFFHGPQGNSFRKLVHYCRAQVHEIRSLALPYSWWYETFSTKVDGVRGKGYRIGSRELGLLLESPSSIQELFVMVDRENFESQVQGKAEDQLEFWNGPGCFGRGFWVGTNFHRDLHGEGSSVKPKVSVAWNFEMILRGEDVELPECKVLDP